MAGLALPAAYPSDCANELHDMLIGNIPFDQYAAVQDLWNLTGYGEGQLVANGQTLSTAPALAPIAVAAALDPKAKLAIDWATLIPGLLSILSSALTGKGHTCCAPVKSKKP